MKPAKQASWFSDARLKSSYVNAGNAAVVSMQDNCTFCNACWPTVVVFQTLVQREKINPIQYNSNNVSLFALDRFSKL